MSKKWKVLNGAPRGHQGRLHVIRHRDDSASKLSSSRKAVTDVFQSRVANTAIRIPWRGDLKKVA